ncbi:MAG: TadE/TadG family type IV pilus assembly protein [Pseudomonadota bacterium]
MQDIFISNRVVSSLKRFCRADGGSLSFEFVITAPVLILLFFGAFAAFEAFRTYSQVAKVAYTLSDIASRFRPSATEPALVDADMQQIFGMHKRLLPARVTDGWVRLSSICWNGDSHRVVWSYLGDDTYLEAIADPGDDIDPRLLPMTDDDIPLDVMPPMAENDSVILTEVFANWTPISPVGNLDPLSFTHQLVARPRFVAMIPYDVTEITGYPDADASLCPDTPTPPV